MPGTGSVTPDDVRDIAAGYHPDPARPLSLRAPAYTGPQCHDLLAEIRAWAPDVERLTLARRLTCDVRTNWKNVVDNFLECYHCHVAHREFVDLVDMSTYRVRTHGICSGHLAEAGRSANAAYDVSGATVRQHAVWWLPRARGA